MLKKKIIITGGLGFIGSNLIELLIKKKLNYQLNFMVIVNTPII